MILNLQPDQLAVGTRCSALHRTAEQDAPVGRDQCGGGLMLDFDQKARIPLAGISDLIGEDQRL